MSTYKRLKKRITFIFSTRHGLAKVMGFSDYAGMNKPNFVFTQIQSGRISRLRSLQYLDEPKATPETHYLPNTYMAQLTNGYIIGSSGVIITDDNIILHDVLAHPDDDNINLTDNGLFMLFGKAHRIGKKYIYSFKRENYEKIEAGISLVWNMSSNYYHFIFEAVAKLFLLSKVKIDSSIPLMVDSRVLDIPQMREIINILNTENRDILSIDMQIRYNVKNLYCFSPVNKILCNRKYNRNYNPKIYDFAYDSDFISYFKKQIDLKYTEKTDVIYPKRIFLTRRNCRTRRCNESEFEPILKQFGFVTIQIEKMTFLEQYFLFSNAEHIIGSSGAAFANLAFCTSGCNALIIVPFKSRNTCYSNLAEAAGVTSAFIAGNDESMNEQIKNFHISSSALLKYLNSIYS